MKTRLLIVAMIMTLVSQAEAERGRGIDTNSSNPRMLICSYKNKITRPVEIPLDEPNPRGKKIIEHRSPMGEIFKVNVEDGSIVIQFSNKQELRTKLNGTDLSSFDSKFETSLESCSIKDAKEILQSAIQGPSFRGRGQDDPEKNFTRVGIHSKARIKEFQSLVTEYGHLLPDDQGGTKNTGRPTAVAPATK